jgi:CO/xanthine dehydrogenase Mo-binding subunit
MAREYRYIGKQIPRRDAMGLVTGRTAFVADLKFPRLLSGKVLRSPHPHAVIKSIDTAKALKLTGVKAVITHENAPDWKLGNPPIPFISQKVRYVGDAVALIAADTERTAERARDLIKVDYDLLPAVFDEYDAADPRAPKLYDELAGNILPVGDRVMGPTCAVDIVMGDCGRGFADADVVVEGHYGYDNIPNPIPMESPAAVADWSDTDSVTIWVSHQAVWGAKSILSKIFGPKVRVRTIGEACGGSFGSKLMSWQVQCYAAALSRVTREPVRVTFSKGEHFGCFVLRPSTRICAKVGMKKDGTITAIEGDWTVGTGYYSLTTQSQVAVGCGEAMIAIRCENWNLKPRVVCTNRSASGIVRGFGGQELKCALFPILSMAMDRLSLDPFEVLKKNFIKPGDGYYWRDGVWYDYRGIDFSATMDRGAETFGWKEKWKGWLNPTEVNGPKCTGVGVGIHGNADIGEDFSEAFVRIDQDGSVMIHSCLAEHGTGQKSNAIKCVAEVLQLPLELVSITPGDSMVAPLEWGPAGSRGTYAILGAVTSAAEDVRKKLLERAAAKLNVEGIDDLDTADGVIWVKHDPKQRITWKKALGLRTLVGMGRFDPDYSLVNCVMSFVEVQIDMETGKLDLLRVVNATDVGKIIDPQGLQGQLYGCLGTAGIDSAIFEETVLDPTTGRILNPNMIDYKWRTMAELPEIRNVISETPMPSHRYHAVGVGEITTSPGPSAVFMAASNACGAWLDSYPVTPDKILRVLSNKRQGS